LAGASHHAVIPNHNTVGSLREVWPRLSTDERRLFDVIARSYLAAMMPDFHYRQTTALLDVDGHAFRATGRQPIEFGWRAAFPDWQPAEEKGDEAQLLPALRDGETASLSEAVVEDKETRPPPRYNEGTLIDAMQNAWRFVTDEALRERLKEAKGIGTPATRAEVIRGLKAQDFLVAQGKTIVPTERGLVLYDVLRKADPALVDPGVTAQLERLLDDVLVGRTEMMSAIDAICVQASRIIGRLTDQAAGSAMPLVSPAADPSSAAGRPTPAMKSYVESLARSKSIKPPRGYATSGSICRAFLTEHAPSKANAASEASETVKSARMREPATKKGGATAAPTTKNLSTRPSQRSSEGSASRSPRSSTATASHVDTRSTETLLRIPYGNKDTAQRHGARYRDGAWYAPAGISLSEFRKRGWV
jgi:DNA topoisomerase III